MRIETENWKDTYFVDRGSAAGLRVGMYLIGKGATHSFKNVLAVVAVDENTVKLKSEMW